MGWIYHLRYTLPYGALQAVRAQFRWGGGAPSSECVNLGYNDRDDLAFAVSLPAAPTIVRS